MRTYIVIPVLDQERDSLPRRALAARVTLQLVLCGRHVIDQLSVREGAT